MRQWPALPCADPLPAPRPRCCCPPADSQGRVVSFKNCLLILTSNVGSSVISKVGRWGGPEAGGRAAASGSSCTVNGCKRSRASCSTTLLPSSISSHSTPHPCQPLPHSLPTPGRRHRGLPAGRRRRPRGQPVRAHPFPGAGGAQGGGLQGAAWGLQWGALCQEVRGQWGWGRAGTCSAPGGQLAGSSTSWAVRLQPLLTGCASTSCHSLPSRSALQAYFRPELLNRMDEVVVFRQLGKQQVGARQGRCVGLGAAQLHACCSSGCGPPCCCLHHCSAPRTPPGSPCLHPPANHHHHCAHPTPHRCAELPTWSWPRRRHAWLTAASAWRCPTPSWSASPRRVRLVLVLGGCTRAESGEVLSSLVGRRRG